jgi:hypothetical protein
VKYLHPTIKVENLEQTDVLLSSGPENFSSYIAPPEDWGEDPTIDPDDDIVW